MRYFKEEEIIKLNEYVIKNYSEKEPIGVNEPTSLDMLIQSPKQNVFGKELYPTVSLKASNLVKNLVKKHVFYNGNKRTALMSLIIFLKINGYTFTASNKDSADFIVDIAVKSLQEDEINTWIINNTKKC